MMYRIIATAYGIEYKCFGTISIITIRKIIVNKLLQTIFEKRSVETASRFTGF